VEAQDLEAFLIDFGTNEQGIKVVVDSVFEFADDCLF